MSGPHSSPNASPVCANPIAAPRTSGGCVSAMSDRPPHITAADAAPCAPRATRSCRNVVASAKTKVASPSPTVERMSAAFAEVLEVSIPAMGAKPIWHRSLLAKNRPSATSLLVVTPSGGGLDTSVWMMGRSIVSCSMSLKRAVATSRTTRLRRRVWGIMMVDESSSPPRMESCVVPSSPPLAEKCCSSSRRLLLDDVRRRFFGDGKTLL
mmetsp:Transcript_39103/g.81833  ORF Transcript_39103/g.81833 Transcript_39103/m.81833 type:complete len:210 (-) Transcript_39103:631-1260(-)